VENETMTEGQTSHDRMLVATKKHVVAFFGIPQIQLNDVGQQQQQ